MAKNGNGTLNLILKAIALAFIAGGIVFAVRNNTERLDKVEPTVQQNKEDVIEMKAKLDYIKEGIDRIEEKL